MEIEIKKYYTIDLVRKSLIFVDTFAAENDLVLVGGLSLDYAFRLKGKKLYEDWVISDRDFVSDKYVEMTYLLFESIAKYLLGRLLDEPSNISISAINAIHSTTMRVMVQRDNIADITYTSPEILVMYQKSALKYNGLLVRHPFFQYMDSHRAFSYPYENPMMEVVTSRWKKDFERLNLAMELYDPGNKITVKHFIECYADKSRRGPPNLSKGKIPDSADIKKYTTTDDFTKRYKIYQELAVTIQKDIIPFGCIAGELAYLLYLDIYNGKNTISYISGKMDKDGFGLKYLGSHYFLNSYIMTEDDLKSTLVYYPVLARHLKIVEAHMDLIPPKNITDEYEFMMIEHKTGYHNLDLSLINPKYPKIILKVVSINFLIMQIATMWIIFKHDMYLSMYLKLLRITKKTYTTRETARDPVSLPNDIRSSEKAVGGAASPLLMPAILPYGEEITIVENMENRPKPLYINKYISPYEAFATMAAKPRVIP